MVTVTNRGGWCNRMPWLVQASTTVGGINRGTCLAKALFFRGLKLVNFEGEAYFARYEQRVLMCL